MRSGPVGVCILSIIYFMAPTSTMAAGNGMYLCPTPATANYFWQDVVQTHSLNLQITADALKRFGEKEGCRLALSPELKPIAFQNSQLLITDGKVRGWVEPNIYIRYVNGQNS